MLRPGDIRPGDPTTKLTAREYDEIVAAVRRSLNLNVQPPLTKTGRTLGLDRRDPFWATLSGTSSPYSFTEAADTSTAGTWVEQAREGTANAYEVNDVAGLADKRALIYPGAPGDYRFQWVTDGDGGGDPPPITCICWHDDDRPATLSWTANYTALDGAGSTVLLGTKSGTLTYMSALSYTKAGGGTCSILNSGSPVAGWIGPWSDYCYLPGAGTSIVGYDRPQCRDNSTCSSGSGDRCRYLWVACSSISGPSGGGNMGWSETFVNTFTGIATCVDNVLPNSGSIPVTTTCDPFSMYRDGFMSFFGVNVEMTITE